MSVNKQILIGNLGKDPDVRSFPDGSKACRFSVAVTEKGYTTQSGAQVPDHTEWFNIICCGKKADVAEQYLHKGDKVYIEGKTYTREYTDQQGVKKSYTEVQCDVLELLTPKAQAQTQQVMPQPGYIPQPAAPQYAPAPQTPQYAPAPQYGQAPVQQPYAPAPAPAAPTQQPPVGVYGHASQAVPVDNKPW